METQPPTQKSQRDRSPDYPAEPLKRCIDLVQKLYQQDRQSWTTSKTAAQHLGYSSLNGKSRTTLSALKKFGLIQYKGGDLRVTDLAMRILVPKDPAERASGIAECFQLPKLYESLAQEFPGWDLPSDETLRARLIRDRGFNPNAVKTVISDLRENLAFVKEAGGLQFIGSTEPEGGQPDSPERLTVTSNETPRQANLPPSGQEGGHKLSVPGASWFVWLPEPMEPDEARRMKRWIAKVLKPQLDFISGEEDAETALGP